MFCRNRSLMGTLVNRRSTTVAAVIVTVIIVSLNAFLLEQTLLA
jgi:manganese transport protein